MLNGVQLVDMGVDWLTVTASDPMKGTRLGQFAVEKMRDQLAEGDRQKPWGMAGYNGWSVGSVQTGEREDSIIVRLGSLLAKSNWRMFYQTSDSCSRLDCQYTLRSTIEPKKLIQKHYRSATAHHKKDKRPGTVSLFTSSDGSSTLYLGKRTSEQFGRIYDKGAESGLPEYEGAIRYEVEFKGMRARQVAELLYSSQQELLDVSVRVSTFFTARGVCPQIPTIDVRGRPLPANFCFPSGLAPIGRKLTDRDRRLQWIAKSVAPFATELVSEGKGEMLLTALGLSVDSDTGELRVAANQSSQTQEV